VRSAREAYRVIWALLAAVLVLGLMLRPSGGFERVTVSGTYDANDLAFVMICTLPVAASLFTSEKGLRRAAAGIVALLAVLSVVRSGSRGGFLGLIAIGTVLLMRLPWRPGAVAALVVGSLVIFGWFASDAYWMRITTIWGGGEGGITNPYDAGGITAARWNVWKTGLRLFLNNPLLGVGAGAYNVAEGYSHGGAGKWSAAHNSFLQIATELGVVGLILFVFVLYRAVASCRELAREGSEYRDRAALQPLARGVEIGLYGYLVTGFGLSQAYSALLYVLLGLAVALKRIASTQVVEETEGTEVDIGRKRFAR
jgi:O-antigen ligase